MRIKGVMVITKLSKCMYFLLDLSQDFSHWIKRLNSNHPVWWDSKGL